jgi:hypothetical protein
MEASEARDHIQWVHGILRTADRTLHLPPATLVAWGLFGTVVNALHQGTASGMSVPRDGVLQLPMMVAAIAVSVWAASRTSVGRKTLVDSNAGVVFWVVFAVLMLVSLTTQNTLIPFRAMALFWCIGFSIALLVVGIQASRPLWVGGVIMLAASVSAGHIPGWFDGTLAVGWALGFVGPGVVLALAGTDGRTAAI